MYGLGRLFNSVPSWTIIDCATLVAAGHPADVRGLTLTFHFGLQKAIGHMGRPAINNQRNDSSSSDQQSKVKELIKVSAICLVLFLAVLRIYGSTLNHEFTVCDDEPYIYGNPRVATGLTWDNVAWSITGYTAGNWHPLTWISHMIDVELYGLHAPERWKGPEAGKHHLTSALLHAAAGVVLFLAMRRLTGTLWCSAFVAAMFALHPLRVESVAWGAERKDVLSGLFWMLTLLAYGAYAIRPNIWRYLLVVLAFGLGLTSKSMLVTLPCVLLLLDFWPLRRWQPTWMYPDPTPPRGAPGSLGWLLLEKTPLMAMSAGVCLYIAYIQKMMGAMSMTNNVPTIDRIANAAIAPIAYIWSTIWPFNLAIFYPHASVLGGEAVTHLHKEGLMAGVLLLLITALVLRNLRQRPYLAVGWFWFLGSLVPVIGLVQVGAQSRADRYTYLPTIGLSIMLVWGVAELVARYERLKTPIAAAAGALLVFWLAISINQVSTWQNSTTVFQHAVDVVNENYFALNHLGLAKQQQAEELHRLGQEKEANVLFEEAGIDFERAVKTAPSYDASNANLGVYYARRNDFNTAIKYFQASVNVNPYMVGHRSNLGAMYLNLGDYKKAEKVLREAIRINPEHAQCHINLAETCYRQGNLRGMVDEWRALVELCPNDPMLLGKTARVLSTNPDPSIRNGKEAVKLIKRTREIVKPFQGEQAEILDVLAMAYAETGQFKLAAETAKKALWLAERQKNPDIVRAIKDRISLYEDGKPYRETLPVFKKPAAKQPKEPKDKASS